MGAGLTELSIRLDLPSGTRFGPGKAQLLHEIQEAGSISGAARNLSMSYPRASRLVSEMNAQFDHPLVVKFQGGAMRGGAKLTDKGKVVLETYKRIAFNAQNSSRAELKKISAMTRSS